METPLRPEVTEDMIRQAAASVMPSLNPRDDDEKERMIEDIVKHYSHPMDGYELARDLDKWESWDCNRDEMETLDGVESIVSTLLEDAEKSWFEQHDIQPPLPIGTAIQRGVIKGINEHSVATYNIQETGCIDPNCSLLIKFEDAVEVEASQCQ